MLLIPTLRYLCSWYLYPDAFICSYYLPWGLFMFLIPTLSPFMLLIPTLRPFMLLILSLMPFMLLKPALSLVFLCMLRFVGGGGSQASKLFFKEYRLRQSNKPSLPPPPPLFRSPSLDEDDSTCYDEGMQAAWHQPQPAGPQQWVGIFTNYFPTFKHFRPVGCRRFSATVLKTSLWETKYVNIVQ